MSEGYPRYSSRPVGQPIAHIDLDRLDNFLAPGQYESQNLNSMLYYERLKPGSHIQLYVHHIPDCARPSFHEATSDQNVFVSTGVGEKFGPSWSTHWFRIHVQLPPSLLSAAHLEFHWDASNEGMVWTKDGVPLHGLSGSSERVELVLPKDFRDGNEHIFFIEMACNTMFGNSPKWLFGGTDTPKNGPGQDKNQPPDPERYFELKYADIVAVNTEARALAMDFTVIRDAARLLGPGSWQSHKARRVATDIMNAFRPGDQRSILRGRQIAREFLGNDVDSARVYDTQTDVIAYGIGHCHIDTCWLWPWAETRRKIARSWANQCDLMDRYPEHRFACSQALQFYWLKEDYPDIFQRVKDKVKTGQFQPIGGSWVEHDTNIPSGESLIRQFLYGQRFFESEFGQRHSTFWLPDTFGYSSQLPQLCRLAGMSNFFTQKLSWNNINNFPHTTFNWVSPDGSQVLCHMTPAETYNGEADLGDLQKSLTQHKSMEQDHTSLLVFGKGDGGGGPTWQHLEKLRRHRGMVDHTGANMARVGMGVSADDFFAQLQQKVQKGTEFATWYGELYFELHRGTYTTQAKTKRNNRTAEKLLHDLEFLATIASVQDKSYTYPKRQLDDMWRAVLLVQFHDCLPGSCIGMCYDESDAVYDKVFATGHELVSQILDSLGVKDGPSPSTALNTLSWDREEIMQVSHGKDAHFATVASNNSLWANVALLPQDTHPGSPTVSVTELEAGIFMLSNDQLHVKIQNGCITSLIHRHSDREVIPQGQKGNQFVVFDDKPIFRQAWDVEVYHLQSREEVQGGTSTITQVSPYRVSVSTEFKISENSWAKSTISLSAPLPGKESLLEFDTDVEWQESMRFLKVEFPVTVSNREASYETQFGVVTRPTHYNTSWDMAKFEVCCHKWADLSDHGFGVSVLNDSKYGFATCGNVMRLSLLRAPKAPDAKADMGRHAIKYALLPHEGGLSTATVRRAFEFNNPMRLVQASPEASKRVSSLSPIRLTGTKSMILDGIKRGEDDEDVSQGELPKRKGKSIVLRIYESLGAMGKGRIESQWAIEKAWKCNILEDDEEECKVEKDTLEIRLGSFEIGTYRLQLRE